MRYSISCPNCTSIDKLTKTHSNTFRCECGARFIKEEACVVEVTLSDNNTIEELKRHIERRKTELRDEFYKESRTIPRIIRKTNNLVVSQDNLVRALEGKINSINYHSCKTKREGE